MLQNRPVLYGFSAYDETVVVVFVKEEGEELEEEDDEDLKVQ